jgi:conjugative relaxase-like TrwC/TraI family protein
MAMRIKGLTNADAAYKYFLEHYYKPGEERGFWHGKLRDRLEMSRTITKADFRAVLNNEKPGQADECLTQRQNKLRWKTLWEKDEVTGKWVEVQREVANRRIATDITFSLTKEQSTYLEKTGDPLMYAIAKQALMERLDFIEADIQTRVRKGYQQDLRLTREALWAVFEDRVGRPVDGQVDPHRHWHCILANATWDGVEEEMKAAELARIYANHAAHEAIYHARINELLLEQGYGFRRTEKGAMELTVFAPEECRVFCKRTIEIEALAAKQHKEMMTRAAAIVQAAAKNGIERDVDSEYAKLKDELGEKCRSGKATGMHNPGTAEFHEALAKQMKAERWEEITQENARNGDRVNFLTPEIARAQTIQHAFDGKSQVREADLIKIACSFCEGSMTTAEIQDFCASDPRMVRNPKKPGMVTTLAIADEEQKIRDCVAEGSGIYAPLIVERAWEMRDKRLDEFQLAAVQLTLETPDLATCIEGYSGAGKSRALAEMSLAIRELSGRAPVVLAPKGKNAIALAKHTGGDAWNIAQYRVNTRLHVQDSFIFVDEFSQVGNADCQWLLDHCETNRNKLVFLGDSTQYQGISRGDPVADLLREGIIESRALHKIYRQKDAEVLEIVTHSAEGRFEESVALIKAHDWFVTADTEDQLRARLVRDLVEMILKNEPALAIAMTHEHIEQITREVRVQLKEVGRIGQDDRQVKWLKDLKFSEAEKADPARFTSGMAVKFHQRAKGGFGSGETWGFERHENDKVIVSRRGQERVLPPEAAKAFTAYQEGTMAIADRDLLLVTKAYPAAGLKTGDVVMAQEVDEHQITLPNGKSIPIAEGVHLRSGYAFTGFVSQGDEARSALPYLPASVARLVNQRSWHTAISRAVNQLRVYTDCVEVIEQRAPIAEDRGSALDLLNQVDSGRVMRKGAEMARVDLQAGARRGDQEMDIEMEIDMANAAYQAAENHEMERGFER